MKTPILIPLLIALAVSGCQSMPYQSKGEDKGGEDKVIVLKSEIGQIRDVHTGEVFYVLCKLCEKPTLKTRYRSPAPVAMAFEPPVAAVQVVPDAVMAKAKTPDLAPPSEPKGQPAEFKRLVPFAFGLSRLGPQGREAMNAVLEEAKAAERVHVRGYTDIFGKMPGNKRLAMARAAEIRTYLVKSGVSADKLSVSYCVDCFSDSNETEAGRAANRRAVVVMRPPLEAGDSTDLDRRDPCRSEATHVAAAQPITNKAEVK